MESLQWGHGDEAVEDTAWKRLCLAKLYELQWGHGDEAVEDAVDAASLHPFCLGFNGATAMKPWKTG